MKYVAHECWVSSTRGCPRPRRQRTGVDRCEWRTGVNAPTSHGCGGQVVRDPEAAAAAHLGSILQQQHHMVLVLEGSKLHNTPACRVSNSASNSAPTGHKPRGPQATGGGGDGGGTTVCARCSRGTKIMQQMKAVHA